MVFVIVRFLYIVSLTYEIDKRTEYFLDAVKDLRQANSNTAVPGGIFPGVGYLDSTNFTVRKEKNLLFKNCRRKYTFFLTP